MFEMAAANSKSSLQNVLVILALAFLLRCVLFLSGVHDWIYSRIEFSTPITSWKRVLEGLSLLDYGISPYAGDSVHEPPLILLLFYIFENEKRQFMSSLVFVFCDLLTGFVLYKCSQLHCKILLARQQQDSHSYAEKVEPILLKPSNMENVPNYVAVCYLLSPFTIAMCVAQSTGVVTNLTTALALLFALLGSTALSMCFIAFAAYKSFYPLVFVVPLTLILSHKGCDWNKRIDKFLLTNYIFTSLCWFLFWLGLLQGLSFSLVGSWEYLDATYGFILKVPDLTPNMGLFWYLFLEMFDHFRDFFIWVFQLNAFFYVIPLSSLLRNDPIFLFYCLSSVIAIFKSYPAFGDFSLPFALLISWSHLYPYMKNVFVVGCMITFSSVLAPLFWYLWIYAGSANANFFYAATLAYNTAQIFLLGDVIFAFLRRNFDLKHGIFRNLAEGKPMNVMLK